jgi:TonB family protein
LRPELVDGARQFPHNGHRFTRIALYARFHQRSLILFSLDLMNRVVVVLLVLTAETYVANGEPAPRVTQVPEAGKTVRDIYGALKSKAIYAPMPIYPYKARLQRWEGRGIFGLLLRPNGTVSGVAVIRSTGVKELDVAAAQALIQWRFPPLKAGLKGVKVPVNCTMLDRFKGGTISDR